MVVSGAKPFAIERRDGRLYVRGDLQLTHGTEIWHDLRRAAAGAERELDIDLTGVETLDGAAVALLVDLRAQLAERGVESEFLVASEHISSLVGLYQGYQPPLRWLPRRSFAERLREDLRTVSRGIQGMVEFIGDTVIGAAGAFVRPVTGKRWSVFPLVARAGTDAIPLVLLLNFLLGFVVAYELSRQLEKYEAQLTIADVIGLAMTRELAPIMTSIVVLGRSAAAYTAELGTMNVSEELDALRTMGFTPVRHLVIPRVLALMIVTPLLTLLGDISGVIGGALVAVTKLGLTSDAYLAQLREVVGLGDVLGGLLKTSVAGVTIGIIGTQQGFATRGGPAGVGIRTKSTVVKGLVALVLIDAFFAIFLGAIRT